MVLHIPDDIALAAEEVAHATGVTTEQILLQVLQAHFAPFDNGVAGSEWADRAMDAALAPQVRPFVE